MAPMILHGAIYILVGVCAGLSAGLFGIGGGLVVVPGLLFIFQQTQVIPSDIVMHAAIATSLAIMIITTLASVYAHHKIENIQWPIFNKLWPSLILGTLSGAMIAERIPSQWLVTFFGIFLLGISIRMLAVTKITRELRFPNSVVNFLVTFLMGTISGILGVGGGVLMVPYLNYCGVEVKRIVPITNLCALSIALMGTLIFMWVSSRNTASIPLTVGYVYWPAIILVGIPSSLMARVGARLHYQLPVNQLRYGFIVLLLLTAIKLLLFK